MPKQLVIGVAGKPFDHGFGHSSRTLRLSNNYVCKDEYGRLECHEV